MWLHPNSLPDEGNLMRKSVTNLCFHGIGSPARALDPGESEYWIEESFFLSVLDLVVGRADVRLSFDDGNRSDLTIGVPALLERGLRAEFFVIGSRLDQAGSLSSDDLRSMVNSHMGIGSHGMWHRSWRDTTQVELHEELSQARDLLSSVIGREVDTAACPLGAYDRRVLRELRRYGYHRVMTSDRAVANDEAWLQSRFSVHAGDDLDSVNAVLSNPVSPGQRLASRARVLVKSLR